MLSIKLLYFAKETTEYLRDSYSPCLARFHQWYSLRKPVKTCGCETIVSHKSVVALFGIPKNVLNTSVFYLTKRYSYIKIVYKNM